MRTAHTVEQVRAAEDALMARLPDGALMDRAATGLACEAARGVRHTSLPVVTSRATRSWRWRMSLPSSSRGEALCPKPTRDDSTNRPHRRFPSGV